MERWWVIRESVILEALRAVKNGEDPDAVLLELLANSEVEKVEGDSE